MTSDWCIASRPGRTTNEAEISEGQHTLGILECDDLHVGMFLTGTLELMPPTQCAGDAGFPPAAM